MVGSGSYDGSVSSRAQMVLWYDEGSRKVEIVTMSGASRPTVDKWLARYELFDLEGLVSMASPGGRRQIPDRIRAKVLALTSTIPPSTLRISHWSSTERWLGISRRPRVCMCRRRRCRDCGGRTT
jgi:Homeodomain-like domain-containing protein